MEIKEQSSEISGISSITFKKDVCTFTELMIACRENDFSKVVELMESGVVDANAESLSKTTAIMLAAHKGHLEIVQYLFKSGAKLEHKNLFGCNAFIYAACGELALVQWLINDIHISPSAIEVDCALFLAAMNRKIRILHYLFQNFGALASNNETIMAMANIPYFGVECDTHVILLYLNAARDLLLLEKNAIETLNTRMMPSEICRLMLDRLPENISLKKLQCRLLRMNDAESLTLLIQFLAKSGLKELELEFSKSTSRNVKILTSLLQNENSKLIKLNLSYCKIGIECANVLASFIKKSQTLEFLGLPSCDLKSVESEIILDAINCNPAKLRTLSFYNNHIDVGCAKLISVLLLNPSASLQSLNIQHSTDLVDGLILIADAMKANSTVSMLNISQIRGLNDDCVIALANMIAINKNLTCLNLGGCDFTDYQGMIIFNALRENTSIKDIDLYFGRFSTQSSKAFGEMLKHNSVLEKIDLSLQTQLGSNIEHFATGLSQNKTLIELDLSYTCNRGEDIAIIKSIAENKVIKKLNIEGNNIGNEGAKQLAIILENNIPPLIYLDLSFNFETGSYIKLFQALQKNNTLRSLLLVREYHDVRINDEALGYLLETLKYFNCTLQNVRYKGNINEIDLLLKRNVKLASKDLDIHEMKTIMDCMKKARWEKEDQLPNTPYTLRFRLSYYNDQLSNETIRKNIADRIHNVDKPELMMSYLKK